MHHEVNKSMLLTSWSKELTCRRRRIYQSVSWKPIGIIQSCPFWVLDDLVLLFFVTLEGDVFVTQRIKASTWHHMLTSKAHWLTVSSANSVLRQTHVLGRLHKRRYFRYCWLRYQEPIVKNFVLVLYSTNLYNLSKKVDIFKESTSNQINMRTFDYSRSYLCIYLFLRFFLFCFVLFFGALDSRDLNCFVLQLTKVHYRRHFKLCNCSSFHKYTFLHKTNSNIELVMIVV